MLYVFWGPDDYSINAALDEIKAGAPDSAGPANCLELEGRQVTPEQLRLAAGAMPFLAEKRLVIVRGLLERFEARHKAARPKKVADTVKQQNAAKDWLPALKVPETTLLVLIDSEITEKNALLKELDKSAQIRSFPMLRGAAVKQWIQKRVAKENAAISPEAVDALAKLVGGNLWTMSGEIEKLVLFAAGRRIEEADVSLLVSSAQQINVFELVDAVLEFKTELAEQALLWLMQRGATSSYILAMLARQFEMLIRAREMNSQKKSKTEMQFRLGLASDFVLHKVLEQATRFSMERLREVYYRLLDADLSIKTGRYDGELALNVLIAELCQR